MKITGGIVTYNNEAIILTCIQSIIEHTKDCDFKLFVYDNCSDDSTVQHIRGAFPQVTVIEGDKNLGFGEGHNAIIRRIESDAHVIINPDIYIHDSVIRAMAEYMGEHPDVVQITPQIRNMDDSIQYLPKVDPSFKYVILSKLKPFRHYRDLYTQKDRKMDGPSEILSATGCFSMVRTQALKQVKGYDPRFFMYFEDADLSRRLRALGRIIYYPNQYIYHAWKRDNTKSFKGICIFLKSMLKYFIKWR